MKDLLSDEDACDLSWEKYAGESAPYERRLLLGDNRVYIPVCDAHEVGFYAGLAHARKWNKMTDDDSTWPAVDQVVLLREDFYPVDENLERIGGLGNSKYCVGPFTPECVEFWTYWFPITDIK